MIISPTVADQQMALDTAIGLFYSILHFVTMDTQKYPPTCQFFSSALTILGQQFLSKVPDQSLQVLQVLMDRPLLANLLIPIFDPNSTPAHFVTQYQQVVDIGLMQHNLQVVFALISKVKEACTRTHRHASVHTHRHTFLNSLYGSESNIFYSPSPSLP